ncbi:MULTISPECIES: FIST signal transduction protein [unclassified Coleofasciculus]|uniref:FIST signal transduction protein n=1 Tax=unclassified Coleofasciculus TaxID=2692782 RepID=UPI00187E1F72|nr:MULTISPECIES: FIST N-terminal domain-containing protein [unclassified Coleofasciculus]MBE9129288.1 FIST C-terminal domain-containing protein [Coleofasciculus sp. LEGE 07081]MBE9151928.1 FIST C-terminal domain-containing protein [Coleofasciculus sp. LEGE 07092]
MGNPIKWANALSTRPSLEAAVAEVVDRVERSLSIPADVGVVFISSAYASEYSRLMPLLQERLSVPVIIGCGGGGIIGMNDRGEPQEVEGNPALSLSVAHLPDVSVRAFHILADALPDLDSPPDAWVEVVGVPPQEQPQFILLADPFSSKVNDLIQGLDFAYPGSIKVGGLASAGAMGLPSGLFYRSPEEPVGELYREGTVGIALSGNIVLDPIVAQGCRPIGQTYQVMKGERNIVLELAAQDGSEITADAQTSSPLEVLRDLINSLSETDRQLAQHSLFIGLARDEFKQQLGQRDFLIRNLLGVDPRIGAIAIGDRVRPGQRIQFHLRDARTSEEDLELLLQDYQEKTANTPEAVGALMFSCLGRGEGLYGQPDFDSQLFRRYLQNVQLGGFFCNGEIGPVSGTTFLHGYTSVLGICRQS